jgi:hypothetical protein
MVGITQLLAQEKHQLGQLARLRLFLSRRHLGLYTKDTSYDQ